MHVAIIMDGNGRWATRRGLPRVAGHRAGVGTVRRVVERASDLGIGQMTLYAFSSDNWNRPAQEVESIFRLMRAYLRLETERLRQRGVRLQIIGRRDRLPKLLLREIERAEFLTADGECLHLRIAVDYSSREAITRTISTVSQRLLQEPQSSVDSLQNFLNSALSSESEDVDLLIRTGGEKRLSDFLLWESAYAELFFTDRMWPDFDAADLDAAVADFKRRERRFGGSTTNAAHSIAPSAGLSP
ncbi:MAG: undecaprenyl diphosphate synthase [Acidobacteriaceae bacterium]|nr:undecaprenyl diphosphate synthase [Acidobacteriaceae bacterium]